MICDGKKDERSDSDGLCDEGEGLRRGSRHGGNEASRKTTDRKRKEGEIRKGGQISNGGGRRRIRDKASDGILGVMTMDEAVGLAGKLRSCSMPQWLSLSTSHKLFMPEASFPVHHVAVKNGTVDCYELSARAGDRI